MKKLLVPALILLASLSAAAQEKTSVVIVPEAKPISIGIVVDNSYSFRLALDFVIDTAKVVIGSVQPIDEAALIRFISKDKIRTVQDFTNDKDALISTADDMYCEGGLTAIPEAVLYSAKKLVEEGRNDRKLLVLITDGETKSDKKTVADMAGYLKENKIRVYIVGITMVLDSNINESKRFLEKLASETGGSVVFVDKKTSAADAGNAIIKAIREQK
jgi:Mg-chelatase subunit ChlD